MARWLLPDVLKIAGGLACVVLMEQAGAGVGTSTLTAQTSVNTNCAISTVGVVFGNYNPIGTNLTNDLNEIGRASCRERV